MGKKTMKELKVEYNQLRKIEKGRLERLREKKKIITIKREIREMKYGGKVRVIKKIGKGLGRTAVKAHKKLGGFAGRVSTNYEAMEQQAKKRKKKTGQSPFGF